MKLRVRTLPKAEADIRSITNYIHQRSPQGAAAWVNALGRALERLTDFAHSCGEADENQFFDIDVRQSFFKTKRSRVFRLLFTIIDGEARILRVRGSGQAPVDPEDF